MNINNYKYGIIVDNYGMITVHSYYKNIEDAKHNLKEIMAETTFHTVNFPLGIKMYIFEIISGIAFTEIKFMD